MKKNKMRMAGALTLLLCLSMLSAMTLNTGLADTHVSVSEKERFDMESETLPESAVMKTDPEQEMAEAHTGNDVETESESISIDETESEALVSTEAVESECSEYEEIAGKTENSDLSVYADPEEDLDGTDEQFPLEDSHMPGDTSFADQPDVPVESETAGDEEIDQSVSSDATVEPENTPVPEIPEATEKPGAPEYKYLIQIIPPINWTNEDTADVQIRVREQSGLGWDRIEVCTASIWTDITYRFAGTHEVNYAVSDNGSIVVRVTDPAGIRHEVQAETSCFDREKPLLTAGIVDQSLHAVALDSFSGVAGIGVNDLLFTTLESGTLDVRLESRLNQYKQLKVYAYDHAGNTSEKVMLDNPYYSGSVCPTKKPSVGNSGSKPTVAPVATAELKPVVTPEPTAVPTIVPEADYSSGTAFQMNGNMQTLDLLFSSNTNKQFISVQTRSGETYYLVIDYDKPIDEKGNLYETYFLNLVDDRDLMDVVGEEDFMTKEPEVIYITPEPTEMPAAERTEDDDNGSMGGVLALLALAGVGGGALWYFKFRKGNTKTRMNNAFDEYGFDDDDDSAE